MILNQIELMMEKLIQVANFGLVPWIIWKEILRKDLCIV